MQIEAEQNLPIWEAEYYGSEFDASGNQIKDNKGAPITAVVPDSQKQVLRDRIATSLLQLIDEYQRKFEGDFYGRSTIGSSVLEITGGGFAGAAAVTSPAEIGKLLSALGAGVIATDAVLQKEILQQKSLDTILARVEVLRETQRIIILKGLTKNTTDYPLVAVLSDIAVYANDGSLMAGLAAINNDTAVKKNLLETTGTKALPTVTWATPDAITSGSALSAIQLNATGSVAGKITYVDTSNKDAAVTAGTVLSTGTHVLQATLAPTDSTNFTSATSTVPLIVR